MKDDSTKNADNEVPVSTQESGSQDAGLRGDPNISAMDTGSSENNALSSKPTRSKKKLLIIVGVAIAVLVAGAVAFYVLVLGAQKAAKQDDFSAASRFESTGALLNEVKPGLKGSIMEAQAYNGVSAVTADGVIVFSAPAYKPAGKEFEVLPAEAEGVGYTGDSVVAAANHSALTTFFKDNKFKLVSEAKDGEAPISSVEKGVVIAYAVYESQDIICAIRHVDASSTSLKGHTSYVGCAERKSYDSVARDLQPFHDSYLLGDKSNTGGTVMGGLTVENGAGGYERAVVYIEDPTMYTEDEEHMNYSVSALFYKKSNDTDWSYFTSLDSHPSQLYCSRYNSSEDIKKAFTGFACHDEKSQKESIVK